MGQVVGGALGGAVSAGITTEVFGGNLGENILVGALSGAATAALTVAFQNLNPLSIADEAEQQGEDADLPGLSRRGTKRLERLMMLERQSTEENTSRSSYGSLPLEVVGGTPEARDEVMEVLKQDLATERGEEMVKEFAARVDASGKPFPITVYLDSNGVGSFSAANGNLLVIDSRNVNEPYAGRLGVGTYDYYRIAAHELGHMAFGPGLEIDNVVQNENAIMRQLGYMNDRLRYQ
jgi:hypothetical protein